MIAGLIARVRSIWRDLRRRSGVEAEMAEELGLHLELRTEDLVRSGLSPAEAAQRARLELGHTERYIREGRASRGLRYVDELGASWLDFKLGARMLVKYPGLALVGGLGMAVGIAIGACFFTLLYAYLLPTLPLDDGERVIGIESWDAAANDREPRSLHDFVAWRDELGSVVEELGAFRTIGRNLIAPDGSAEPVPIAEMTASGFRIARVPPLLGRSLVEEDERKGAPPVIVIGHEVWRTRFASDPAVLGWTVRLGSTVHTVVGVMPEGFAFPVNHRFWTPLQADPSDYERRQGPGINVFGRLAPGVTLERAQAELTAVGRRTAAAFPATHEHLRPRIVPYTTFFDALSPGTRWEMALVQTMVTMLLVVVCVNVAILVYARTATRQGEIAVRTALGASRRRIVTQLFVEALVLSAAAAAAGLVIAKLAIRQMDLFLAQYGGGLPFWIDPGLSTGTVLYVLALTALAAVIVGVVPALKATGRRIQSSLRHLGGATGMQLGRTWNVLIVAQVAFAVAVLPAAVFNTSQWIRYGNADPGFAAEEFLMARLGMDRETPPSAEAEAYEREFAARYGELQAELVKRLEAQPGVSDVTTTMGVPGEEPTVWVEVDGVPTPSEVTSGNAVWAGSAGHEVRYDRVDVGFFDALDVPILTGRPFRSADLGGATTAVVVNRSFVQQILGDGNALGRRVCYVGRGGDAAPDDVELGRWYEIVGVIGDFPANAMEPGVTRAKLYHPMAPGEIHPVSLALRVRGTDPGAFAGRLREITTKLDPSLRLHDVMPLDEVLRQEQKAMRLGALAIGLVTLSVLLLSAAGIYALMSFTVAQRRREIGIRSALGAGPHRILGSIFARALAQLAVGVVVGLAAAALLERLTGGELMNGEGIVLLPAVSVLMMTVGLAATLGPARRGLRIQPTEALKADV